MAASPAIYTPPNAPHTPLARKSARFASSASPRFDVVADSPVHNRAMLSLGPDTSITSLTFMPPTPKTSPATVVQAPGPSPGRLNFSLQQLASESRKIRLEIRAKEQEDKATPKTYDRHLKSYETWWDVAELAKVLQNNKLVALPAMPIIASKVAMFLQYETTREKVSYYLEHGYSRAFPSFECLLRDAGMRDPHTCHSGWPRWCCCGAALHPREVRAGWCARWCGCRQMRPITPGR